MKGVLVAFDEILGSGTSFNNSGGWGGATVGCGLQWNKRSKYSGRMPVDSAGTQGNGALLAGSRGICSATVSN